MAIRPICVSALKGETQINDQLTGYGQWEYNVQANTTEGEGANSWTRLAFAGLKFGDYGSFDYGRNYGVLYDVEGWTDMLPEFGGDSYTYADNYMTGRANGVATYRNTDFFGLVDGLNFALQYQGKNESQSADDVNIGTNNRNNGDDIRYDNGDGFGISTTYDIGMGFSRRALRIPLPIVLMSKSMLAARLLAATKRMHGQLV